jgi:hydrogenase expression/formation protein HypE
MRVQNRAIMKTDAEFNLTCPLPIKKHSCIQMAHGGGGRLTHQLIEDVFLPAFGSEAQGNEHDSTVVSLDGKRLAFTTDSYVVRPILFPGGDIGSLAVHGTVNDLAMSGARPLCLSAGFIIEEGLPMDTLQQVVHSMSEAARRCGVRIVTGDTKVVDKSRGDGLFINTAGIGVVEHSLCIEPRSVRPGDAILVSGDLGRHGMAIMSVREGLEFNGSIESDSASVSDVVLKLINAGVEIHCLRDLTRGGLASALNEIAQGAGVKIVVEEQAIPVREDVHAVCELLGLDPLHVACEGRFVAFVAAKDTARALCIMQADPVSKGSVCVGDVRAAPPLVVLKTAFGASRILDMPSGEQLPRIC